MHGFLHRSLALFVRSVNLNQPITGELRGAAVHHTHTRTHAERYMLKCVRFGTRPGDGCPVVTVCLPLAGAAPSSMLVLVDLQADFFLCLLLLTSPFPPCLPLSPVAIHIAACPSHIHWPCPGSALLVFRPVVVERYTPT